MLTAFVAPIPVFTAAEIGNTFVEKQITKSIPINIHKSYREAENEVKIDVEGMGIMVDDDMHIVMTIITQTYNSTNTLVSDDIRTCKTIIPNFNNLKEMIDGDADEPDKSFTPAYQDWGTFTRYYWRNKLHVSFPGSAQTWVRYDHPDNYYTYHREQWNLDWNMYDSSTRTTTFHYGVYQIQQALTLGVLGGLLSGMGGLAALAVATMAAWLLGVLAVFALGVYAFVALIVAAEQGDGWGYFCGPGTWPFTGWYWISFGIWRDLWWAVSF